MPLPHQPHLASRTWARHVQSLEPAARAALAAVQQSDLAVRAHDARRVDAVVRARAEGCTWIQIAAALGISRQGAQAVYGRYCIVDDDRVLNVDDVAQLVPEQVTSS